MSGASSTRITSSDGVELVVHDFGGDGPVILFAHATGFHGMVWTPLIESLLDSFRCISLDFRGHGDSTVPDHGSFDWAGFGDDILATIEHLAIDHISPHEPLYGVGHSKGGAALLMAEQRAPGTFAGLYLFEPIVLDAETRSGGPADGGDHPLAVGARKRRSEFPSRQAALDNYAEKPPLQALDPRALAAYVNHGFASTPDGTLTLKCLGTNEAAVYEMGGGHNTFDRLGEVDCPVTVAAGALDSGPSGFAESIAKALPRGKFVRYEQLGHFGPLEDPDLIGSAIRETFTTTGLPESASDEGVAASVAAATPGIGHSIGRFDAEVDRIFDAIRGNVVADRLFYSASAVGDWSLIWHLVGAAQGITDHTNGWRRVVRLTASLGVESALVNGVVKSFFRRSRPTHDGDRPHALRMPATSSFPSGHASSAFMAAHLLADRSRFGVGWYAIAAVVASSRVYVRIHHASDVVGGAALGLVLGAVVKRIAPLELKRT